MELKLIRKYRKTDYTIGILYVNNKYFCEILEDTDRGLKDSMSLEKIKKIIHICVINMYKYREIEKSLIV